MQKLTSSSMNQPSPGGLSTYAIQKELKNVQIAFKFLDEGDNAPVGINKYPVTLYLM